MMRGLFGAALAAISVTVAAVEPDWSRDAEVGPGGRPNPYALGESDWRATVRAGRLHALHYPVEVTGLKVPYGPVRRFLNAQTHDPFKYFLIQVIGAVTSYSSFEEVESWLGLHSYPASEGESVYEVPWRENVPPAHRMGFTRVPSPSGEFFTISCAQCHTGNLFGRKVIGLTNRFPRANEFFQRGLKGLPYVSTGWFRYLTGANPGEIDLFKELKFAARHIEAKRPAQLGLDTSLAQVSLSLARRSRDAWASRGVIEPPAEHPLRTLVSDSKPAVWWNVKYKTRWLSDGSIVSGNPIFTNFIWNEIGRGVDLLELADWLRANPTIVTELTAAVFAAEAPPITDFFVADRIDEASARRGERVFMNRCTRCHGVYEKAWNQAEYAGRPWAERLRTVRVHYLPRTRVVDVGTDPGRHQGMRHLARLNDLEISRLNGIVVEPQKGYVPPPLVGIWARWPYMHNNSIPTLCAVLTPAARRPVIYWAREADDPTRDFDFDCNGYPATRPPGATAELRYDTRRPGLGSGGHDEGILTKDGVELLTAGERRDLIRFLQTL